MKKYTFWDYVKVIMSVAFVFTIGLLWSGFLERLGLDIVSKISNPYIKFIIEAILIVAMTVLVIAVMVYLFKFEGEDLVDIIKSGI